ncbi:MAG: OmpP1/FadL family transporter [Vibrio fluvialis]
MKVLLKVTIISTLFGWGAAQAGGLSLYETNATDTALASAGMAARAQDASVMAANPAGVSHVPGRSFSGNLISLYGDATLETQDPGHGEDNAGNVVGWVPMGSAFYSQSLNERWTAGIGVYGNYGLGLKYDSLFSSVDIPKAVTQALTFQPTISYRLNERWSLGGALGVQYALFDMETRPGGEVKDTDTEINGRVGVLYEGLKDTRIGLAYMNQTEFEFEFDLNELNQHTSAVAPQQVMLSVYHNISPQIAIMGNINWQDWSQYHTSMNADTQDTYQIALGMQYQQNHKIRWNAGIAYDSSMLVSQSDGDWTLPTGETYRIGGGFDYQLDNANAIGFALEAAFIDSSSTSWGNLVGAYHDPAMYFLNVDYTWKG